MVFTAERLDRDFFARDSVIVARELLGQLLVTDKGGRCAAIITETEAYFGSRDPASHAYRGLTKRNHLMFGQAGIAYVYLCYGMYNLFNIVTRQPGDPGAVLIRGAFPVEGQSTMRQRIKKPNPSLALDGPGKLTIAMGIGCVDNGRDLTAGKSDIFIEKSTGVDRSKIKQSSRIGIRQGKDKLWRFYISMTI